MTGGLETVLTLALLALGPLLLLTMTCFVKVSVVLSLARNAIGAPQVPPNLVIMGLALLLSMVVMAPVAEESWKAATAVTAPAPAPAPGVDGLPPGVLAWLPAVERAAGPLRTFLARHAHAEDRATFQELGAKMRKAPVADDGMLVLAPAFATSELTEAFAIGFLLLVPFLVLDLVVGLVLTSLGLTTVSATQVALPLKLLLFVAIDGWRLLAEGLILGYA